MTRILVLLALVSVSTSCGGGGGGGGGAPPLPPPSFDTPIEITAANAYEVLLEFGVSIDTVYLLSVTAVSRVAGSAENDFEEIAENCGVLDSLGTRTITFVDNDGDATPNRGDQFVIEYADDCEDRVSDKYLSGTITVDVSDISLGNAMGFAFSGQVTFGPNLMIRVPDYERRVSGTVAVESFNAGDSQVFEVQIPAGGSVQYSYDSQIRDIERSSDAEITSFVAKRVSYPGAGPTLYSLFSYGADIESSLLGGSIHCESSQPISRFDGQPGSGENIECYGAGGSAAVGRVYRASVQREFADTYVDEDGDGTYSLVRAGDSYLLWLNQPWGRGAPGYSTFADSLDYEPVAHDRYPLAITDSVHDVANGHLYVLGPADLIVLDDSNLNELDRLALAESYSTMALSDSGGILWLAVSDKPELHSVDTATLQVSSSLVYTSPVPSGNVDYIEQLAVVPGSEDHVVALVTPRNEITSFRSGSELPATIAMTSAVPKVLVVADAQTLYTSTGNRHPQENLIEVAIDPAQGLSIRREFPGYLGDNSSTGLYFVHGEIIGDNGRVISTERDTVAGMYDNFTFGTTGFVASFTLDRVFAIRNTNQLNIYRRDSRALVGTYRLDDFSLSPFRRSHVSDDNLLLTFADTIIQVPLANLPDNSGRDTCKTEDFSGLLAPGTAFQVTCQLESATYDPLRDRLYLGVSPEAGGVGNTILSVDPNSGLVEATVIVGSKPGKSRMSSDGAALYVALPDANELVEVSLSTFQVTRRLPLGFQRDYRYLKDIPAFPTALEIRALGSDDFVVTMNEGDLSHYLNGAQLPNKVTATRFFKDFHLASDGSKGVAIERGESQIVDIDASGATVRSLQGSLFDGHPSYQTPVMRLGDELFKFDGDIFDLQSESLSNPCNRSVPFLSNGAAAPAPAADKVTYYLIDVSNHSLTTCDRATGVSTLLPPPVFFGLRSHNLLGAFHTQSDMLVLASRHGALILDAPR